MKRTDLSKLTTKEIQNISTMQVALEVLPADHSPDETYAKHEVVLAVRLINITEVINAMRKVNTPLQRSLNKLYCQILTAHTERCPEAVAYAKRMQDELDKDITNNSRQVDIPSDKGKS